MTKILFIGSYLSRSRGTKDVTESLAENLASAGFLLKLVSRCENKFFRMIEIIWEVLKYDKKKVHIDVFSGPAFNIAAIASTVAFFKRKEIILTLHGGKLTEFGEENLERINKLFKRSKYIQTPSLFLKEYFTKKGFLIHYLPNAVDLTKFPFGRDIQNPYSLLWVRGFTSIYNPDLAIKILFEVRKKYPLSTMTMVGPDNGQLNKIIQLAKDLGLNDVVTFAGPKSNDELYQYYQTHSVFLNTTTYESFGVAVVEAAACGIPIVSTKVGEIPYLWKNEKDILMVDDFDANSFAKQIFRLFQDEEFGLKLSDSARKKAETFSWEKIKPEWIKLLSS